MFMDLVVGVHGRFFFPAENSWNPRNPIEIQNMVLGFLHGGRISGSSSIPSVLRFKCLDWAAVSYSRSSSSGSIIQCLFMFIGQFRSRISSHPSSRFLLIPSFHSEFLGVGCFLHVAIPLATHVSSQVLKGITFKISAGPTGLADQSIPCGKILFKNLHQNPNGWGSFTIWLFNNIQHSHGKIHHGYD